jgi:aromatic-L-amino-acid decarboxylase
VVWLRLAAMGDDAVMVISDVMDPALPGWEWSVSDLRVWAHAAADLIADVLIDGVVGPAVRCPPHMLLELWDNEPWPDTGARIDDLWQQVKTSVAAYPFGNAHPRFSAWVNSPPHPLAAMTAGVAAAMNPSVAGGNHAAVHLEHQVVRWFCQLLGWSVPAGGQLVSGASAAALTALAVARHRATVGVGFDDRRHGLTGLNRRPLVYASVEAHSCHTKAVEALGIGSDNIVRIATDAEHRMLPEALAGQLSDDRHAGHLPVAVIASAGTVNTGAVDALDPIADVCARHGVWLHVDAAYGGPAVLLLDEWAKTRAALARADSIAVDAHKWLYVPVDAGLILFADTAVVRDTFSLVPDYLRSGGNQGEPVWFSEYGLEQTRPFRALKVWMALKHLGRDRLRDLITRDIAVAAALCYAVDEAADFELLSHGLSVVCFRHRPPHVADTGLDDHNQAVLHRVQNRGDAFIAGTRVGGRFALRACIINPATTTGHTAALLDEIRLAAREVTV